MNKFSRAIRHLTTMKSMGKKAFPDTTLHAIQSEIASGESAHRAEVRLIVEPALDLSDILGSLTSRERAAELFTLYRIWDTEENSGVLIYVNLADHQVEIIADRGIARLISADDWQAICVTMTTGFAKGEYHSSTIAGLQQLNTLLHKYFPEDASQHQQLQHNQLSNQPIML